MIQVCDECLAELDHGGWGWDKCEKVRYGSRVHLRPWFATWKLLCTIRWQRNPRKRWGGLVPKR